MNDLALSMSPGQFALSVALGAAVLVAACLISFHAGRMPAIESFARLLAVFVVVAGLYHAGLLAAVYVFLRAGVRLDPSVSVAQPIPIQAVVLLAALLWDAGCLMWGKAARSAGYGTRLFSYSTTAFIEGALPFIRIDAMRRLRRSVIAAAVAAWVCGTTAVIVAVDGAGLPKSFAFLLPWAAGFGGTFLVTSLIYRFIGNGDPLGDAPISDWIRPHPADRGGLGGRVLSKQEAARVLEE